ncbi:MAG TPA: TIGR03862 family flavoprotein, partial [Micropepsaceae bacterium]|nr:TIGR03862 family flavoprotein [Micropepsaceae bacterium]
MTDSRASRDTPPAIAIIGGGPAGLMAAEILSAAGLSVTVYERMPTPGRKLLIAGRGGLNLTHSETFDRFVMRYGAASSRLASILEAFPPSALIAWAEGLGQEIFVGSSGRVFPKALKASPLLRAWLARLSAQGVRLRTRHEWLGWDESGNLIFREANAGTNTARADVTILALGGASWPKLGSDGAWAEILARRGVSIRPFRPANCGFTIAWSQSFRDRFEGKPLKNVALGFAGRCSRGDAMITRYGIEGGAVYALSAVLRDEIAAAGRANLEIDLRPDLSPAQIVAKLKRQRPGQSATQILRKALNLSPLAINLMRESHGIALPAEPDALAARVKSVALTLTGTGPIDRAISTAGGLDFSDLDETLMLRDLPGIYAAGEMLDWEAPTGGYLLQASFATGVAVARSVLRRYGLG